MLFRAIVEGHGAAIIRPAGSSRHAIEERELRRIGTVAAGCPDLPVARLRRFEGYFLTVGRERGKANIAIGSKDQSRRSEDMAGVAEPNLPEIDLHSGAGVGEPMPYGSDCRCGGRSTYAFYPSWRSTVSRYAPQTAQATALGGKNDFPAVRSPGQWAFDRAFV